MMNNREKALVTVMTQDGTNVREAIEAVKDGTFYENLEFITDLGDYLVLTEGEREGEYNDRQKSLIEELGLEGFTEYAQEHILNNFIDTDLFNDIMKESNEYYIKDIKYEEGRLEEEMEEVGVKTEEEYLEVLNADYEEGAEWYKDNFGEEAFSEIVKNQDLMNVEEVIEWCKDQDGYAHTLATYDGEELKATINGTDYYIYRTN